MRIIFPTLGKIVLALVFILLLGIYPYDREAGSAERQARYYQQNGQPLLAAQYYQQAAVRLPWRTDLLEQAGITFETGGDAASAVKVLGTLADGDNLSLAGQEALAGAYETVGQSDKALALWSKRLQAGSAGVQVYRHTASLYRERGDIPNATTVLRQSIADGQVDARLRYDLGILTWMTDPQSGMELVTQAAVMDSAYQDSAASLAQAFVKFQAEQDPALKSLEIGRALGALGEWDLASIVFERLIQAAPDFAEGWALAGEARQQLGQPGKTELDQAYALDPYSALVNALHGLYWQRKGKFELASIFLGAAADLEPENPAWQAGLGDVDAQMGKFPQALDYYQKAVALDSRNPLFWQALAGFSLAYEFQVEEIGLPAARQAYLLEPGKPGSLDLLGQAFLCLKDMDVSERLLLRALQVDPAYPPAHLHLAQLFLLREEPQKARPHLEWVAQASAGGPAGRLAQRLLDQYFGLK